MIIIATKAFWRHTKAVKNALELFKSGVTPDMCTIYQIVQSSHPQAEKPNNGVSLLE